MEKSVLPLVKVPPLRGGDFQGIAAKSPSGYPSAWLHPCRARFRFTWRSHCSQVRRMCKRDGGSPKLPLLTCLFEFAIAGRVNFDLASGEHIVWRYIADGTVQAYGVIVIHVGLNQTRRVFSGQRCARPNAFRL